MTYHGHLSEEDYIRFNEYFMLCTKEGKKGLRIYRMAFPVVAVIMWGAVALISKDPILMGVLAAVFAVISVIWICTAKRALRKNVVLTIAKMKENGKLPYEEEGDVSFDDGYITETSEHQTIRYALTKDLHTVHYGDFIYVFFSSSQAIILHEKYLEGDKDEVLKLLEETTTFETAEPLE